MMTATPTTNTIQPRALIRKAPTGEIKINPSKASMAPHPMVGPGPGPPSLNHIMGVASPPVSYGGGLAPPCAAPRFKLVPCARAVLVLISQDIPSLPPAVMFADGGTQRPFVL